MQGLRLRRQYAEIAMWPLPRPAECPEPTTTKWAGCFQRGQAAFINVAIRSGMLSHCHEVEPTTMVDAGVTEHFFETDFSNHIGLFGLYGLGMHDQDGNSADVRKGTAEPGPGADRQVCPRGAPRPSTLGLASTSTSREPEPRRQMLRITPMLCITRA